MSRIEKITWASRAKVVRSELSTRKQWVSDGGHYAIEHAKFVHPDLSAEWRVLGRCSGCDVMVVLSHHRTRNAAEVAANKHRGARS